ncbi:hypothetical protein [uncultured Lacinutrix sp.]|uniref:hypothetical protein n=1 Tax=uncultured Lacinutrix sp. TaxID=574032 RepID=UPI00260D5DEC|nr:hypothetical protein [uncultured Lacinutrix sp.]
MEKLKKEHLQFIDNYLDNSDIVYADIRMEMTDHVASEIENRMDADNESSFYDVFKVYMVENKADLLSDNKKYINSVVSRNSKLIFKELVCFKTLIVFLLLVFLLNNYLVGSIIISPKYLFAVPVFSVSIIGVVYFIGSKAFNLSRFSGVERLGFMYYILFQFLHMISIITQSRIESLNSLFVTALFALCITLIYVFVKVTIKVMSMYYNINLLHN